jgi:hypothetical protein
VKLLVTGRTPGGERGFERAVERESFSSAAAARRSSLAAERDGRGKRNNAQVYSGEVDPTYRAANVWASPLL